MKEKIILVSILLLGMCLRFYQLGINPPSLDWDEASQGYNAYSILTTGKDEYGNLLPLSIRSFDDYKPPAYTYLTASSVALFGLTLFAVRLPSAVIGTFTIIVVFLLTKEIEEDIFKKKHFHPVALLTSFFFAISPWSLQFSRAAFEGNIGVFFFALGLFFFFQGLKNKWYYFISSISFLIVLYSYHSFRLLVPLLFIALGVLYWKELKKQFIVVLIAFAICFFGSLPILQSLILSSSTTDARFATVTIFSDQTTLDSSIKQLEKAQKYHDIAGEILANRRIVWISTLTKNYLEHFSPDFLFLQGDSGQQHQAIGMGMLYLWDLPFLLIGIYALVTFRNKKSFLVFFLILIAPVPSAVATGAPHAVRDIGSLPFMQIAVAIGVFTSSLFLKKHFSQMLYFGFVILASVVLFCNFLYYLHQYYVVTPRDNALYWQYGYQQVFAYAKLQEKNYQHILVTYYYDQPYIYYLFFNKINPSWYQHYWQTTERMSAIRMYRKIGKYEFLPIDWSAMRGRKNTLIIASPHEVPDTVKSLHNIYFPDGSIAFEAIAQ
ncbi:MAG TPA: glycosyltransferase family 39 protein [Patescibacteria group bacterium]|nr:glycosyltransferase family 39 protein [Patescibacteria group bacterium]